MYITKPIQEKPIWYKTMRYVPTEQEVLTLLNNPDISTLKGMRDKAILELLYASALRRMEVANLNIEHINFEDRTVRVVRGKGDKDRIVPMTQKSCDTLRIYLEKGRPLYNRYPEEKALFLSERNKRLSMVMIGSIIKEYASFNPRISCHSLRHAAATHMLKRGANILYIQQFLGHSSPKTTQIYTRLYPKDLIEVYRRFHPRKRVGVY